MGLLTVSKEKEVEGEAGREGRYQIERDPNIDGGSRGRIEQTDDKCKRAGETNRYADARR